MKEKTIAMATAFTMLLAVGVAGFGGEILHDNPAYKIQQVREVHQNALPAQEPLLLAAPEEQSDK